jgi:hypothetical protein
MTDIDIIFFRFAAAMAVAGMSFLPFMIPSVVRLLNENIFSLLNHFGAGVFLGLSIVCFPVEAAKGLNGNFPLVTMIGSMSFLFMISMEQLSVCSGGSLLASYSYESVRLIDDSDEKDIEMSVNMEPGTNAIDEGHANNCDDTVISNTLETRSMRVGSNGSDAVMNKRFFPSSILGVTSIYAIMYGLSMGARLHEGYGTLERLLVNHFLISLTLGTVLEFMRAPRSYFGWFAALFSISSPIGILSSGFIVFSENALDVLEAVTGVCTAIAAGVFLYLASSHILPAEMLYLEKRYSDFRSSSMKVSAMFFGFLLTALPAVLLGYN